ncbi:MAG: septum formation initiator family protein [Acidimicrobiia bacterium]|nr:septum formation initiator family protein [Acidimicrobiia bacterium]
MLRRLVLPTVLALSTAAALVIGVFPTRTYLDKRDAVAAAEERLEGLQAANAAAEARVEALQSDTEIERLARRDHGLAYPGEETYVVLPPPMDPPEWPTGWPFTHLPLRALPD